MSDSKRTILQKLGMGRIARRATGFRRDEGGAMIAFGLTIFVMMMWIGGMAIDFMRFEHARAKIAYTTDRASLAAASLNQTLGCEEVARDYFNKAGIDTSQVYVKGQCDPLSKKVLVAAETQVKSLFLNLIGIETLTAGADSIAEEHTQDVEISLVLDVSGSMSLDDDTGTRTKMEALQEAAGQFLDIMLTEENAGRISINLIPYSTQVNAGEDVLSELSVSDEHDYSHCVNFAANDYETVDITKATGDAATLGGWDFSGGLMIGTDELERESHVDHYYNQWNHPNISTDDWREPYRFFNCPTTDWSAIRLMSQNLDELKQVINQYEARGSTSIEIGVKWGAYFLNENANGIIENLPVGSLNLTKDGEDPRNMDGSPVFDGDGNLVEAPRQVPEAFEERPYEFGRPHTRKILIVMSDGKNTTQYTLNEDYRDGLSPVFLDEVPVDSIENYNWLSFYEQRPGPNNDYFMSRGSSYDDYFNGYPVSGSGTYKQLTWPELWRQVGFYHFNYYFNYAQKWNAQKYYDFRDAARSSVSGGQKDTRMDDVCDAAKAQNVGITIFTIGFEVSETSADQLRDCATKEANYFNVSGSEIEKAFSKIAKTIQRLQLTN